MYFHFQTCAPSARSCSCCEISNPDKSRVSIKKNRVWLKITPESLNLTKIRPKLLKKPPGQAPARPGSKLKKSKFLRTAPFIFRSISKLDKILNFRNFLNFLHPCAHPNQIIPRKRKNHENVRK